MRAHHVRDLLMGGQACVFYGAAEISDSASILARLAGSDQALVLALCKPA